MSQVEQRDKMLVAANYFTLQIKVVIIPFFIAVLNTETTMFFYVNT